MRSPTATLHTDRQSPRWGRWRTAMLAGFVIILIMIGIPQQAEAHASLTNAVPGPNDELQQSPSRIVLTFNERLEEGGFYIKVYDSDQKTVTDNKARMNASLTSMELELPDLRQGSYLVTYHVISADGHPVEGTYLFAVGQSLNGQPAGADHTMDHMHSPGLSPYMSLQDIVNFASRIFYYVMMLLFTGWVVWLRFGKVSGAHAPTTLGSWGVQLQRGYLIAFLIAMFSHLYAMIGNGGQSALASLFAGSAIGYIWLTMLALSLLSFIVLYRNIGIDLLWVALLWLFESLNGHAAAFEPKAQTILLNLIHLGAAALWIGGLLMLLVLWFTAKDAAAEFFPRFSVAAGASLILLAVTGVVSAFIFLPDIRYVIETQWGRLLLIKSALVLFVVVSGTLLRVFYRKRSLRKVSVLLRVDAILAVMIAVIVGVFTYLSPLPVNQPLNWHVMGDKIHMTTQITPNVPGINDFTVKVWLPEDLGKPKQVLLRLSNLNMPDIAPIDVPLTYTEDAVAEESYGLKKHTYTARGAYMPYPGDWRIVVRVMDTQDNETPYERQIRLY
jgi:copper transport protein